MDRFFSDVNRAEDLRDPEEMEILYRLRAIRGQMMYDLFTEMNERFYALERQWDAGVERIRQAHLAAVVQADVTNRYGQPMTFGPCRPSLARLERERE